MTGIIIPAYNVSRYIRETVQSVIDQDERNWLAVVIDDGSPDDVFGSVRDLIQKDSRLRYFRKDNGGVSSARNHGLRILYPEVDSLIFLDGDDLLEPEALRMLHSLLWQSGDIGVAYSRPHLIDEKSKSLVNQTWLARWTEQQRQAFLLPEIQSLTPFDSIYCLGGPIPSTALIRKDAIDIKHGFDEDFGQGMEDTDFVLKIALKWKVVYYPQSLTRYRRYLGQSSSSEELLERQAQRLYEKWRALNTLTVEQRALVDKAERFRVGLLRLTQGWMAGNEAWSAGERIRALRFKLGAIRRWPCQSARLAWDDFWSHNNAKP